MQTHACSATPSHNCCFRSFPRFPVYRSVSPSWKNSSLILYYRALFSTTDFSRELDNSLDRILLFTLSVEKCIESGMKRWNSVYWRIYVNRIPERMKGDGLYPLLFFPVTRTINSIQKFDDKIQRASFSSPPPFLNPLFFSRHGQSLHVPSWRKRYEQPAGVIFPPIVATKKKTKRLTRIINGNDLFEDDEGNGRKKKEKEENV